MWKQPIVKAKGRKRKEKKSSSSSLLNEESKRKEIADSFVETEAKGRWFQETQDQDERKMQNDQNPQQLQVMLDNSASLSFSSKEDDEMSKSALSAFREKEEEIDRMRTELHNKLQARLGRVQEESRRLASIREELEAIGGDPMRKEITQIRKKIDALNKELKPLGLTCQKKEKEYKDALDVFNEKNNEKVQLISKLMEMVGESEKLRLKKLEELSKHVDNTS